MYVYDVEDLIEPTHKAVDYVKAYLNERSSGGWELLSVSGVPHRRHAVRFRYFFRKVAEKEQLSDHSSLQSFTSEQVRVLTIADTYVRYAQAVTKFLTDGGLRTTFVPSSEKLGVKMRTAKSDGVPIVLVIGEKELDQRAVTAVQWTRASLGFLPLNELSLEILKAELDNITHIS